MVMYLIDKPYYCTLYWVLLFSAVLSLEIAPSHLHDASSLSGFVVVINVMVISNLYSVLAAT